MTITHLDGVEDSFVESPNEEGKSLSLTNIHKSPFSKDGTLLSNGLDSCWKIAIWSDMLQDVFHDNVLASMNWKKCFQQTKGRPKKELFVCRVSTDTNFEDVVPLFVGWNNEHVKSLIFRSQNVVLDWIMHRIHTYVCGLSYQLSECCVGWNLKTSTFTFSGGKVASIYSPQTDDQKEAFEEFRKRLGMFDNVDKLIAEMIIFTLTSKRDYLLSYLNGLLIAKVTSILSVAYFISYGFRNFKLEVEWCKKRCLELHKLLQDVAQEKEDSGVVI